MAGPNYSEVTAQGHFFRENILRHLQHIVDGQINFAEYMHGLYDKNNPSMFGLPVIFIYDLKLLELLKDKCVTFYYNSMDEISKGAAPLSVIYQLDRDLHLCANIHYWREAEQGQGQVTVYFAYKKLEQVLEFIDNHMEYVKKPAQDDKAVGFLAGIRPQAQNPILGDAIESNKQ